MISFGDKLKSLRKLIGKTQQDVAAELCVKQATISYLEKRHDKPRDSELLKKLFEYFNIEEKYFDELKQENKVTDSVGNYVEGLKQCKEVNQTNELSVLLSRIKGLPTDEKLVLFKAIKKDIEEK